MKTYISQEEFEWFRKWLVEVKGIQPLEKRNEYELLAWKHEKPGRPMPIAYRRDVSPKITLNTGAADYWRVYEDHQTR